ncbi:uncharacterized protein LOC125234962 [Leguminivora glycinivorella]|uniref:uncharacterized protein LOC125234962 n=1 Tax=Leguminivora glycinivorella TaxID=1035111 RepID=UPI00200F1A0B|nr:uncharacterized protein LOC125234962 [Leguminivora glycinivorella]
MNPLNYISDEEFLPFLLSLEVESDRKSFEWMFNDPELSGVLQWLYNSLDHSNALTAREKYRYAEIEQHLLSPEDLDSYISSLQEEFPGLCLPGDQELLQAAKTDVQMQSERLRMLERHETVVKDLVKKNDLAKEELSREITKLNSAQHQLVQDEASSAEECLSLAGELETLTDGVVDVIADTLSLYSSAHGDKEIAKKFLSFGPFESYKQAQTLFASHFDLYVSRKFSKRQNDAVTDGDLRCALVEASVMGERLTNAAFAYIDAKTELAGEQAKLALVANYQNVHPSRIAHLSLEEQAALDLEQEEPILDQQIQDAVKEFVEGRTRLAAETTARSALAVRERIHSDLSHLLDVSNAALCLDRALYYCLRAALRGAQEFLQLTSQLKEYYTAESAAAADRIKSMNEICYEQELCERRLDSSDQLVDTLHTILGVKSNDALLLYKGYCDLRADIDTLKENLYEAYENRELACTDFQKSTLPLRSYIWDGCTKLPNCWNTSVAAMTHNLKQEMEQAERKVSEAGGNFSSVKNGDKQGLRKLWQYFLTDQNKLAAAMRAAQTRSFC